MSENLPTRERFLQALLLPTSLEALPLDQRICAICREDWILDESDIRKLPCEHAFCFECISTWFAEPGSNTCPICRTTCFQKAGVFPLGDGIGIWTAILTIPVGLDEVWVGSEDGETEDTDSDSDESVGTRHGDLDYDSYDSDETIDAIVSDHELDDADEDEESVNADGEAGDSNLDENSVNPGRASNAVRYDNGSDSSNTIENRQDALPPRSNNTDCDAVEADTLHHLPSETESNNSVDSTAAMSLEVEEDNSDDEGGVLLSLGPNTNASAEAASSEEGSFPLR